MVPENACAKRIWRTFSYHMIRSVEREHILVPLEACGFYKHLGLFGAVQICSDRMYLFLNLANKI